MPPLAAYIVVKDIPDVMIKYAFLAAARDTGMTEALKMAGERIPVLLSMKPETVEAYFASRYAKEA